MKNKISCLLILCLSLVSSSTLITVRAEARPNSNKTHYCGTDKIKVPDGNLSSACKAHDQCLDSGQSKKACQDVFESAAITACENIPEDSKKLTFFSKKTRTKFCRGKAIIYLDAIRAYDSYNNLKNK